MSQYFITGFNNSAEVLMNPKSVLPQPFTTRYQRFTPGDLLLTYNIFSGWQKPIDQAWTNRLTLEQIRDLKPADQVWVNYRRSEDHIVGFRLVEIVGTEMILGGLKLRYATGGERGGCTVYNNDPKSWPHELTNENAVYFWTQNHRGARRER